MTNFVVISSVMLICTLVLPNVLAVSPFTQSFTGNSGLQITYPLIDTVKINTPISLEFHIYNLSDGRPMNTGISCTLHIYNSTGFHIVTLTSSAPTEVYDYTFNLTNSIFTAESDYHYLINCNTSSLGGFQSVTIQSTNDGKPKSNNVLSIVVSLCIIALIFLLIAILLFFNNREKE